MNTATRVTIAVALLALIAAVGLPFLGAEPQPQNESAAPENQQPQDQEQQAQKHGWGVWYEQAVEESRETGKPILANFTGSDWCPPCIAQEKEVFSKEAFQEWAEENVVLLELDFPRRAQQSEKLREQNQRLKQQHEISGFPTVMVLTAEGEEVARYGGYRGGMGLEKWLERTEPDVEEARPEDPA